MEGPFPRPETFGMSPFWGYSKHGCVPVSLCGRGYPFLLVEARAWNGWATEVQVSVSLWQKGDTPFSEAVVRGRCHRQGVSSRCATSVPALADSCSPFPFCFLGECVVVPRWGFILPRSDHIQPVFGCLLASFTSSLGKSLRKVFSDL